jgi:23S rRNA (pseudouridine1915-N3)-methyltransferase
LKLTVLAVGKIKEANVRSLANDYLARIGRYCRIEEIEVKDASSLEKAIPNDAIVVACEVFGKALTSEGFARQIERWGGQGKGVICLLIGGADGLPEQLSTRASFQLSLSSMTLPHRLARVLLFEQLYRAFTILRGEPYARE